MWLVLEIHAFHRVVHTNTVKVFHEDGLALHEGGTSLRMVSKATSESGFSSFIAARNGGISVLCLL